MSAADVIRLEVVTPDGAIFSEMVESVQVPAAEGSLGVLANHAPLMAQLLMGLVTYRRDGNEDFIYISGGYMEVSNNHVMILAGVAECANDIDEDRAKAAKERAEKRLRELSPETDVARARAALHRATYRLKAKSGK